MLLDGAPAGRTNEQGYVLFEGAAPASIAVRRAGWVTLESAVDREEGEALFRLVPDG